MIFPFNRSIQYYNSRFQYPYMGHMNIMGISIILVIHISNKHGIPVVPHKAVAEVSQIGNL